MPYIIKYDRRKRKRYYWIEQIDFEYSQYCDLSETNSQSWLDDKKRIFNSVNKFIGKRSTAEMCARLDGDINILN
jgi:hypothetical protein